MVEKKLNTVNFSELFGIASDKALCKVDKTTISVVSEVNTEKDVSGIEKTQRKASIKRRNESMNGDCTLEENKTAGEKLLQTEKNVRNKNRRLTFVLDETPTSPKQCHTAIFREKITRICGPDIFEENVSSEDDEWEPESITANRPLIRETMSENETSKLLIEEFIGANKETDVLEKVDNLLSGNFKNENPFFQAKVSNSKEDNKFEFFNREEVDSGNRKKQISQCENSANKLSTEFSEEPPNTALQEFLNNKERISHLRVWFIGVRQSYMQGVRVLKVSSAGKKFIRVLRVDTQFFKILKQGSIVRRCHLAFIKNVKLGFNSPEFRKLLEVTPENSLVSPHENCIALILPNNSVSLITTTEHARNELLLLLRILSRRAKLLYGNQSQCFEDQDIYKAVF